MNRGKAVLFVVALALMAAGGGLLLRLKATQRLGPPGIKVAQLPGTNRLRIELPERLPRYVSTNLEITEVERQTLPDDTTIGRRLYGAPDGFQAMLSVVLMGTDRTSIHKPEFCLAAQGWAIGQQETTTLPLARPQRYDLPIQRYTARMERKDEAGRTTAWSGTYVFWFVAEDKLTAGHWSRMTWSTRELLGRGVLPRWAYVACFSVCPPGQEDATFVRMKQFLAEAVPEFQIAAPPAARVDLPRLSARP